MDHIQLSDEQLMRFREAFAFWDTNGDGTINARDLGNVVRHVGPALAAQFPVVLDDACGDALRIKFDELVSFIVRPQWHPASDYDVEEILDAFVAYDDGSGYVPLRDVIRALDEYLEDIACGFTDAQLVEIFYQALDVSMLDAAGRNLAPEVMWNIFAEEFAASREEEKSVDVGAITADEPAPAAATCESPDQHRCGNSLPDDAWPQSLVGLTVVDLSGEKLLAETCSSSCFVADLQQQVEEAVGLPVQNQVLLLAGRALSRKDATLLEVGVLDDTSLMLVVKEELKVNYKRFAKKLLDFL